MLTPPERLRVGPFRAGAFRSRLHDERLGAVLGIALGVAFTVCFLTGVLSHLIQHPPGWFEWPARPVWLYRVTQGTHVAMGLASIPLLFAKLWVVYPHLWTWPPFRSLGHVAERAALLFLVGGSVFLLFSGLANIGLWYPWTFFFPAAHFWAAWITIGALIVHIGAKAGSTRRALFTHSLDVVEEPGAGLTRRGFLGVAFATSGLVTLLTVGQTFHPLNRLALLAPRRPDVGPQGFPVNKSAVQAGVTMIANDPAYRLRITGDTQRVMSLSLDDLRGLELHEAVLPISCVEGWSASATWRGVRVRDLLALAGAAPGHEVEVRSMQAAGRYASSILSDTHASDGSTLLALEVNGEELHIDHGFPLRLIGPNRPGVMQTKWVRELRVL